MEKFPHKKKNNKGKPSLVTHTYQANKGKKKNHIKQVEEAEKQSH